MTKVTNVKKYIDKGFFILYDDVTVHVNGNIRYFLLPTDKYASFSSYDP